MISQSSFQIMNIWILFWASIQFILISSAYVSISIYQYIHTLVCVQISVCVSKKVVVFFMAGFLLWWKCTPLRIFKVFWYWALYEAHKIDQFCDPRPHLHLEKGSIFLLFKSKHMTYLKKTPPPPLPWGRNKCMAPCVKLTFYHLQKLIYFHPLLIQCILIYWTKPRWGWRIHKMAI